MKYLYLLYADESETPAPGSPEMNQRLDGYNRFYEEITGAGVMRAGDPVQASATSVTVRAHDGTIDKAAGPHAAGAEQIIGYYVLDVASEAEAVAYAAKIPAARHGAVEVRPILEM